ncbi:MAG: LysM peptidoglycan-binding domain-containing protein [Pseudomonadales bacterium]|nr:LysM peptidoglycan-binding domain-containing protein [Pseudomonadales bacterium]
MKYFKQFSTICALIVILSGCQQLQINAQPDRSQSPDPSVTAAPVETGQADHAQTDDVVIAAAMSPDEDGFEALDTPVETPVITESPVEADLWNRIRKGFALEHYLDQPRVQSELNWYARHPEYLDRVAKRASRYLYHIVEEIEARNMPMEMALLPVVESAFDPFAYSHGRASGLWQFIPSTARLYGLHIDYWHDGRRDVKRSTAAALDYLERLHGRLDNDWYLALASYNSGEGNVRKSMRKNARAGKPLDFFSLKLLRETSAYVPRLLAISAIIADPQAYGISLLPLANEPYWDSVNIDSQIDLAVAARAAGISIDELYLLNPAYNKWSTHPDGPHELLIPVNQAETFRQNLADLPVTQRLSWQRHKVKSGESLGQIARRYNTSIEAIKVANKISGSMIRAGANLMVPVASGTSETYELSDTQRLKDRQEFIETKTGQEPVSYVVKSGDNLWELSRKFGVSMRQLARWNGMATTDVLMPGKELKIFVEKSSAPAVQLALIPASQEVIRKVNYRVRQGESLARIASKFNVPVSQLRAWNKEVSGQKYIQPGDNLTLYVDVTRTE